MELTKSPVRDAIHELRTYSLETLAQRFDVRILGARQARFCKVGRRRWQLVLLFPRIHSTRTKYRGGIFSWHETTRDILIRKLFTNIELSDETLIYRYKSPIPELLGIKKHDEVMFGAPD